MAAHVALVLAAGQGKRMNSPVAKQYLLIKKKPVLYYALREFERCPFIDEIVITAGADDIEYCRHEIVEKYGFSKVHKIVPGGKERYHSVYNGLLAIGGYDFADHSPRPAGGCDYVYIHDGARPFVTQEILQRAKEDAERYGACAVGVPTKDTIRISDENGFGLQAPDRSCVWQMQTPQAFSYPLVFEAYEKMMKAIQNRSECKVTDDAMVVETWTDAKVKLTMGSYSNLKITTPEDLKIAEEIVGEESGGRAPYPIVSQEETCFEPEKNNEKNKREVKSLFPL